jgi:hypothetical protein
MKLRVLRGRLLAMRTMSWGVDTDRMFSSLISVVNNEAWSSTTGRLAVVKLT